MWIVWLALKRPYTFIVLALVIMIVTPLVIMRMPVDVLPDINIPVVSVVWFYAGLSPAEMADRIITNSERGLTITVNDIEHLESQSLAGIGVIKIFFQPGAIIHTDRAIGAEQQDAAGTAAIRSRTELPPDPVGYRTRRRDALPLWRQDAPDPGGHQRSKSAGKRVIAQRYRRGVKRREPDFAVGYHKNGLSGVPGGDEWLATNSG